MIRCRVLGSVELRDAENGDVSPLLAQPKRLALLVYMLVANGGGFHRRDTLVGLFWPELDETRARDNLSQALRFLRQSLGTAAILSRGQEDVAVDPGHVWCDVSAFRAEMDDGRVADALDLYRGELLQGFFITDAAAFEEWLDGERTALRTEAARAARQLAEDSERHQNLTLAVKWGRRAVALAGDDERAFRRLLALLARAGDRAGALHAYDDFSRRLRAEYEAEPAAETRALVEQIRRASGGLAVAQASPPAPLFSPLPADSPSPSPFEDRPESSRRDDEPLTAGDGLASGRYVIERPLGAGGMAAVYLARDVRHGRNVAIKVLRPDIGTLTGRRALLHEIRIAAALQHPHIVPLFDSGESDGRVFYVMPHIVGESLRARLARGEPMALRAAVRLLREVASALAYAHRSGIVHRDIKPENILMTGDAATGEVHALVADFGIAKALDASLSLVGQTADATRGGSVRPLGTPGYMAPEQAAGEHVDRPADVYSWGVVAYELLAGVHPFAGRGSAQELMAAHLGERPTPLSARRVDVPPPLATLVMRCLEKDPAARPADGATLLDALESAASSESPVVRLWKRVRPFGSRRRVAVAAIATTAVVGVAGAWAALGARRDPSADAKPPAAATPRGEGLDPSHIAVLYFEDLSPGDSLGYIANAITTYLTDELAAVPGLTVASLDAVRRLRREPISLDSMARWLGVRSLVTGSVASHDDTLAVTVRLVDGISGRQLASAEEQAESRDVFKLQRDLALRISGVLRERLGQEVRLRDERRGTQSVEAWNLLEQARALREAELWFESSVPDSLQLQYFVHADSLLARAERIDPRWAAPHIEHSTVAHRRATFEERRAWMGSGAGRTTGDGRRSPEFWRTEALRHAERALDASPGNPRALLARARARNLVWRATRNAPDSIARLIEADLRAAAEAAPASGAWSDLSTLYRLTGRFAEAAIASDRAVAADAFLRWSQDVVQEQVVNALFLGRFDDARQRCAEGQRRFPRDPRLLDCDLIVLAWTGTRAADADRAWRLIDQHEREDPSGMLVATRGFRRMYVAAVLARAGLRDSAEAVVRRTRAELERQGNASSIDYWESHVHVLAGRPRDAVARLTSFLATNPAYRGLVANTPWFAPLRSDSAFARLVAGAP